MAFDPDAFSTFEAAGWESQAATYDRKRDELEQAVARLAGVYAREDGFEIPVSVKLASVRKLA